MDCIWFVLPDLRVYLLVGEEKEAEGEEVRRGGDGPRLHWPF